MSVIEVRHLSKIYRVQKRERGLKGALFGLFRRETVTIPAVFDVSFEMEKGELVGFLGPNGAGKTTTLKMLSGILYPTSGEARVLGFVPWEREEAFRRRFSLVMGQKNQLWWDLPARESFALNAAIYDVPKERWEKTALDLAERLGVRGLLDILVRELSLGERMKMELIAALLHEPEVLFLDEPTIGLDVSAQRSIRAFLKEYNRKTKTTVLLTSHYMNDIQALCERVLIINHGRKVYDASLSSVVERFSQEKRLTVRLEDDRSGVSWETFGKLEEAAPGRAVLRVPRADAPKVSQALMQKLPVEDITVEEVPIEEVIEKVFRAESLEPLP